jgi:hypothetical protein
MESGLTPEQQERILTPAELAARYPHATEKTVADWRYKGTGPRFFRAGKYVCYRLPDVLAWEAGRTEAQDAKRAS